jgi:hypothetical protein
MTVRELVRDVVSRFFDLESGLLHTAWRLTVAPGTVSRDVIAGRRRRYAGPVTYLVVVATLSILSFLLVEDAFSSSVQVELATVLEEENLLAGRDPGAVAKTISRWTNQGTLYFSVFIAVVFAALGRWVVPGWKQRYNFAESCVFALYATAHGFLLLIPFNVLFLAGPRFAFVSSVLGMLVFSAYVTIAARTFVRRHWATAVLAFFAFAVSYFSFLFVAWTVGVALIAGVA